MRPGGGSEDFDKAEKLCKPSMLSMRMKADWESATPLYEKAATSFRVRRPCLVDQTK